MKSSFLHLGLCNAVWWRRLVSGRRVYSRLIHRIVMKANACFSGNEFTGRWMLCFCDFQTISCITNSYKICFSTLRSY
jgi:hypothetical protein